MWGSNGNNYISQLFNNYKCLHFNGSLCQQSQIFTFVWHWFLPLIDSHISVVVDLSHISVVVDLSHISVAVDLSHISVVVDLTNRRDPLSVLYSTSN